MRYTTLGVLVALAAVCLYATPAQAGGYHYGGSGFTVNFGYSNYGGHGGYNVGFGYSSGGYGYGGANCYRGYYPSYTVIGSACYAPRYYAPAYCPPTYYAPTYYAAPAYCPPTYYPAATYYRPYLAPTYRVREPVVSGPIYRNSRVYFRDDYYR